MPMTRWIALLAVPLACATFASAQPATTQPATTQPATAQPATAQPATVPQRTWDFSGGQWHETTPVSSPTTQRGVEAALDRAERLLDRREWKAARAAALDWVLANKTSPNRDRGLFLIARALYGYGDRIKAFYYCDELLDDYPESNLYQSALELQYRIADRYLDGYKRRWLGIPLFYAKEEGVEMLYRIRNRAPGSPLAERALLRTADHYRFDGQFDFAADAYHFYATNYPRSPMTPRARLWGAYCSLAQFHGLRFDPTPVIDAREQLRSLAAAYPDLAKEENIDGILKRIDSVFAKKLYTTATYYRRVNEPRAASYTYKYLIKAYPQAPESERAKLWLTELPQWAQNLPGPTIVGEEGAPTPEQRPVIK